MGPVATFLITLPSIKIGGFLKFDVFRSLESFSIIQPTRTYLIIPCLSCVLYFQEAPNVPRELLQAVAINFPNCLYLRVSDQQQLISEAAVKTLNQQTFRIGNEPPALQSTSNCLLIDGELKRRTPTTSIESVRFRRIVHILVN